MKVVTVALCLALIPSLASAQTSSAEEADLMENGTLVSEQVTPFEKASSSPTLQLKVGPGFSTLGGDFQNSGPEIQSKTGLHFAAEVDLPLSSQLSLLTGLNFIQKGLSQSGEGTEDGVPITFDASGTLSYLEIPALLKLNFGEQTRFSLLAGPYLAYRTGATVRRTDHAGDQTQEVDSSEASERFNNSIARMDAGLRFGATTEFPFTSTLRFVVGAYYDLGLKNINADSDADTASIKNRTFLANAGIGIEI